LNKLIYPLAVTFVAAIAPLAHAGLEINYSIDGGPTVTCGPVSGSNPSVSCSNVSGPDFDITLLGAASNSPGGTPSQEESATVDLSNAATTTQSIVINVISTGFTSPTTPPALTLTSNIGGSVVTGSAANVLNFISCVDQTDSQTAGCPATDNAPTVSPNITSATSHYDGGSTSTITTLSSPYAIDEQISVTLGVGANMNFSASTTLAQVPEPMSIILLGSVVLLVSGLFRRKLKSAAQV
jgi:hypothetical protein